MHILKRVMKVFKDSVTAFAAHNCLALSASISFYAMFSFFPLVLLTVSIFAAFAGSSEEAMRRMANLVTGLTPVGANIVMGWVHAAGPKKPLAWGLGIVALIWGARHVFNTLALSASIIWGRRGWREVLMRQLLALLLVGFAALMLLGSLFLPAVIERIAHQARYAIGDLLMTSLIVVPYVFSLITFTTVYLLTTPRNVPKRNVILSAAIVSLTWEIAKNAFLIYIHMTKLSSAYGAIGGIIVLMTWVYCSSAIVLWGMELVAAMAVEPREPTHLQRRKGILVID
ncbi:MAG TPA: YihY/virulence factor BrkB family protein [bacterium]|nr:YihY/virulence factor BrkB family protein [bacterium]